MLKKSFTLIEVILSLIIFSLLFLVINNVVLNLKNTRQFLLNINNANKKKEILIKVLYEDLLNADTIKIVHSQNSDYDRVYLVTSNSLYNLVFPNVLWYVSKKNNTLIRIESPFKINVPNDKLFFIDKFDRGVKLFKIYQKEEKILVILNSSVPIYFEIYK